MELNYLAERDGEQVGNVLRHRLGISVTLLRRLKYADAIRVNGESVYTTALLRKGDVLTVRPDACDVPPDVPAQAGALELLYEDEICFALNKPAGTLVHPSHAQYTDTLLNYALERFGGNPQPVNRLDRDTSGVVLYAKCAWAKELLCRALSEGSRRKEYLGLVFGVPPAAEGTLTWPIRRRAEHDMERVCAPDGAPAVTRYFLEKTLPCGCSLLRLSLETGRTHQLRVHLRELGCPLVGDRLYHSPESAAFSERFAVSGQLLHAAVLSFTNPFTASDTEIFAPFARAAESPLPDLAQAAEEAQNNLLKFKNNS